MSALVWLVLGAALGGAATLYVLYQRRRREERRLSTERDHAVRSLDSLRGILQEYIEQREDVEETLRESERQLRLSEERLRTLVNHAAYGIYRCDLQGNFIDANPAMLDMLGYEDVAELQRLDVINEVFVEPSERLRWREDVVLGRLRDWYDFHWRRRDGSTVRVRVSPRLVLDGQERPMYCDAIAENVTERLRREELVRRGERMAALGRTLAGVAHEINNPLAAIAGFAQLLLKGPLAEEERRALETMLHEAQRAARIVKDLLAVARRQESHEPQPVDVNSVVRYIAEAQRYALDTHGIRCVPELAPRPAVVHGDPAQLEQVVLNLVVNARQALEKMMDDGTFAARNATPTVFVRTSVQDDVVGIEVSDNGPGIAAADLPRIFDPFFTTKGEGEGSGLGLAVVHGIVTQHGGAIDVVSTLGRGSTFRVSLPRDTGAAAPADAAAVSVERPADPPPRALDILVVDDEKAIRALLERAFTARGHAVMQAAGGEEALQLAGRMPFDVVVCDMRMPGMNGREVVRRMRELPTCREARFILSSGDSTSVEQLEAEEGLGVNAVVNKPYDLDALRRVVEHA